MLKIRASRIHYAIITGMVAEPKQRLSNRRVFEAADIRRLAAHFKVSMPMAEPAVEEIGSTVSKSLKNLAAQQGGEQGE